jgi:glycosyltransferase involved in cell wall biosynthesis
MKMKILLITTDIDKSELYLFKKMYDAGLEIYAICNPNAQYYQELKNTGIPLVPLEIKFRIQFSAIKTIRKILKTHHIDIIHALRKPALSNAIIASYNIHMKMVTYRGVIGGLSFLDFRSWLSFLNPKVDKIICVAKGVHDYFLSLKLFCLKVPKKKLITIPKGHDIAWYESHESVDLKAYGIPENAMVVGCMAAMRSRKGIDVLIKSMDSLPSKLKNTHLILGGHVRDKKISKAYEISKNRSKIHFTGNLPHNKCLAIISKMDLFVLPAIKPEGLPRSVIEAMAQGVPAVVTQVPGSVDLVQDYINGRIVKPGDTEALAEAIAYMLEDRERLMVYGLRARKRIVEDFNISTTFDNTMAVYRDLLKEEN